MATPNDTIDPNDLDSIDALLDEAEWNADENLQDSAPLESAEDASTQESVETETPQPESPQDIEQLADIAEEANEKPAEAEATDIEPSIEANAPQAELDAMLDAALDEVNEDKVAEPADTVEEPVDAEVVEPPVDQTNDQQEDQNTESNADEKQDETLLDDVPMPVVGDLSGSRSKLQSESERPAVSEASEKEQWDDEALPSRLQRSSKPQTADLTVKEMDALKKLIIIFGSASLTLIVITLGIAVWAAIAASSSGFSEENQALLESVKVNSELSSEKINVNYETLESLEKKLDAINFQIEQLAGDIAGSANAGGVPTKTHAMPAKGDLIDPLGLHTKAAPKTATETHAPTHTAVQAPVQVAAPSVTEVEVKLNSELIKKVSSVNYKVIKLQKSITELNTRLKALQSQQANLTDSVKVVEKEILLEKAAKLKAEREIAEQKAKRQYQPGGYPEVFSDPTVGDSYP